MFANWDRQTAFGCQVWSRSYAQIALMNCSNYPLDKSVYSCVDYSANAALINGLDLIRRYPESQTRTEPLHGEIESHLITLLKQRLEWVTDNQLIVPCGKVANALLGKCNVDGLRIVDGFIPHPSRNHWTADDYTANVDILIQSIDLQINE